MLAAITDTKTQQQIRVSCHRDIEIPDPHARANSATTESWLYTQRNTNKLPNSANYSLLLAELHDPEKHQQNQHPEKHQQTAELSELTRCYWQSYTTQQNQHPEKHQQTAELSELLAATGRVTRPRETATDCRTQRESLDELLAATGRVTHPEKQ